MLTSKGTMADDAGWNALFYGARVNGGSNMKKRLLIVALAVVMAVCLVGCDTTYQEATGRTESNTSGDFGNGYFTTISEWGDGSYGTYRIVYANDTKVKYFVNTSSYRTGITPLYNADGTLQIYEESED